MRQKEPQNSDAHDLFRSRLDQIADMSHPLGKLARAIDWGFLEESFGAFYTDAPDAPALTDTFDDWSVVLVAMNRSENYQVARA